MNDDELRNALSRRAATPLTPDDRNDLLRATRLAATEPRRRSFVPRVASWVAGAAAALALVILVAPVLLSPPLARPSPTAIAAASAPSSVPSVAPSGIKVYTAQELANMVGDPNWVGKTILAEAAFDQTFAYGECPPPDEACLLGSLQGVEQHGGVLFGWRDATPEDGVQFDNGSGYRWIKQLVVPTEPGVFAFNVRNNNTEYLGPAYITSSGEPVKVSDIQGISSTMPSDGVIAVGGWLTKTWPIPPCAAPPELLETPRPALDYYCDGSWVTATEPTKTDSGPSFADGIRVQNDAYEFFAAAPSEDERGVDPQQGVYLVRNAGCPEQAPCPAWRMVGRLDDAIPVVQPSAAPTPIAPETPVTSPVGESVPIRTNPPTDVCMDALLTGELVADATWGVAVRPSDSETVGVIWPNGFTALRQDGQVALIDDTGATRAVTGDTVLVGGGFTQNNVWIACGQVDGVTRLPVTPPPPASPPPPLDPVPLQTSAPTDACDAALLTGVLVADKEWGLAIQSSTGEIDGVIWPNGFTAIGRGDDIELIDDTGATRAVTGDTLLIGGGLTTDNVWGACGQVEVASPPPPADSLYIENRGGPSLVVEINGSQIVTVGCNGYEVLVPAIEGVPTLPWDLEVFRGSDGESLSRSLITGLPRWYTQIGGESLAVSESPVEGPPGPTCPPK